MLVAVPTRTKIHMKLGFFPAIYTARSSSSTNSRCLNGMVIWDRLPQELWDLIEDHIVVGIPQLLPSERPRNYPLLYPHVSWREPTNFLALACTSRRWCYRILSRAWRHIVVSKPAHVATLLAATTIASASAFYDNTLRCDVMLPAGCSYHDVFTLLAKFPRVRAITLDSPPLQLFSTSRTSLARTITSVQLGVLPRGFAVVHLERLSISFPEVRILQVLHAPAVTLTPTTPTPGSAPLLANVDHLSVGCPWEFLFDEPPYRNHFLGVIAQLPEQSIFPDLTSASIERYAGSVSQFLQRHGGRLKHLACGSLARDLLTSDILRSYCHDLTSLTLTVDANTESLVALPIAVTEIVVLLPFLRRWREVPDLSIFVLHCLEAVASSRTDPLPAIRCETRGALDGRWIDRKLRQLRLDTVPVHHFSFGKRTHNIACSVTDSWSHASGWVPQGLLCTPQCVACSSNVSMVHGRQTLRRRVVR